LIPAREKAFNAKIAKLEEARSQEALETEQRIIEQSLANAKLEKESELKALRKELEASRRLLAQTDRPVKKNDDGPMYMDVVVANRDIARVKTGMPIRYKVDAFPHLEWGTLEGQVESMPKRAVQHDRMGYVFVVRGSLPAPYYHAGGARFPIKPGMTGTAELVTERKSLMALLFRKLSR
jgi:hypothetical protein